MPQNVISQWIDYIESYRKHKRIDKNHELNFQESRANKTLIKSYPSRCYIEITNQCNLRCPMCGQAWFEGKRSYIPELVLNKIKELFPYLKEISVFGFGESLVDKRFFNILDMLPRQIWTRYVSNGILIDRHTAEKLIQYQLNNLFISIDAATEDTFIFVRGQKGFERIINNIQILVELKKKYKAEYPHITMCYTLFRRNAEEFLDFIDLAHSLGVQRVSGDYLIVYREDLVNESLYFDQALGNNLFRRAREKAKQYNMELMLPKSFEDAQQDEQAGKMVLCYEPWEFVYFRSDGHIGPCCVNDVKLGDLNQDSFDEIWNGELYQKFRAMVNKHREQDFNCAQCMGHGMRKITDKSFHIKILDKEGKVLEPNFTNEPTLSVGSGTVII